MRSVQVFAAAIVAPLFVSTIQAASRQDSPVDRSDAESSPSSGKHPIIEDISFEGLRRIAAPAVMAQIRVRVSEPFDSEQLDRDVRRLARLGWFAFIRVEEEEIEDPAAAERTSLNGNNLRRIHLRFLIEEQPFLTGVAYHGSRLLSQQQIEKLLADKNIVIKLGEPENPLQVFRAAGAIRSALADLGHPEANAQLRHETAANGSVRLVFEIADGPRVPVASIAFEGDSGISTRRLRRQMVRLQPGALLATVRRKNIFTQERFTDDRERLLTYYRDHGYPEARVGTARIAKVETASRRLPWSRKKYSTNLLVVVPVAAGPFYKIDAIQTSTALREAVSASHGRPPDVPAEAQPGKPYAAQAIEILRRTWEARVQPNAKHEWKPGGSRLDDPQPIRVEAIRTFDPVSHRVGIYLDKSSTPPYLVRRIEFRGQQRFSDNYLRRRIPLREGAPFDDKALAAGLARLARTTYFKPIRNEDIRVLRNDQNHTVDVSIRVEEVGRQRVSLVGGHGQFGSTLGIAYTVFDLFHGEELLSSRIEGGPESLQLALGFAKEGFLGSRGSLALSVFNALLRPHLAGSAKGPFFKQQTEGLSSTWNYALSRTDTVSLSYELAHTVTQYSPIVPVGLTALLVTDTRTETSSRSVGAAWTHGTSEQRIAVGDSVSGGWLGGTENAVRTKVQYSRIWRDSLFDTQNAWAVHATFSGVGSYSGNLPLYARIFAGDDFVRGLRPGAIGPQAIVSSTSTSGATRYSTSPAGANLAAAASGEYRIPLSRSTEMSGFFDSGSGALLPNWLGTTRPSLIDATNRVVHASTGIQVQWTVPGIGVPLRAYYAVNVLRLDRWLPMPDGSSLHARDRLSAFGWALAPMF
jgi:outer membrane protein assembly factor BamA